jgi:hypothetical protein
MSEETARYETENPFGGEGRVVAAPQAAALASIEQQREIAKVQAMMIVARRFPRDPIRAADAVMRECTRQGLAEKARYSFSRGGQLVEGPTIDLLETIARCWGNLHAGFKELGRRSGYSEVVSYAWDLETGYYEERQFQVRHWRDTKSGGRPLTDERDIYEAVANMAQRRKRAVLESVIPRDITDAALEQCETTLRTKVQVTPEGIAALLKTFEEEFEVSKAQIERWARCHIHALKPAQFLALRRIYAALRDGLSEPEDWFEAVTEAVDPATGEITDEPPQKGNAGLAAAVQKRRGRPPKAEQQVPKSAEVVDQERKPPEAAKQAGDGAGGSSETNAEQRSPAAETNPVDAGGAGGSPAPSPSEPTPEERAITLDYRAKKDAEAGLRTFRERWLHAWKSEDKAIVRQNYEAYEGLAREADRTARP